MTDSAPSEPVAEPPIHKRRWGRVVIVLLGLYILGTMVALAWLSIDRGNTAAAYKELSARYATDITKARAQGANIPDPKQTAAEILQGEPGPVGPQGPGPTDAQVEAAVTAYLTDNPPAPGRGPTPSEIAGAVATYCAANDCRGPAGQTGATGATGADGGTGATGAQGDPGPGPTDDQVATAVATYCSAHNGCVGPAGPPGSTPTGPYDCTITSIDVLASTGRATCDTTTTTTEPPP